MMESFMKEKDSKSRNSCAKKQYVCSKNNVHTSRQYKGSSNGQESWGRDSGARDLSPETQRMEHPNSAGDFAMENEMENVSMIDLASKFHVAALSALNSQVIELKTLLQNTEMEKDNLKSQLKDAFEENERVQRLMETVSSTHESRITEMHCVIVELNKKLRGDHENAIIEENEPEGSVSELSYQEGSIYNSEMEEVRQSEPENVYIEANELNFIKSSPSSLPHPNISTKIQALQEEILHLRSQVALLQSQLANNTDQRNEKKESFNRNNEEDVDLCDLESIHDKSNYTSDDLCETADILDVQQDLEKVKVYDDNSADECDMEFIIQTPESGCRKTNKTALCGIGPMTQTKIDEMPVAKMAERVKLRRTIETKRLTGANIINSGICSTEMAETLVSNILQPDANSITDAMEASNHIKNEWQRLQRRIEHLKVQNTVLSLQMIECKQNCDHLYLLCGKYESNAIALQQALNCSDRAIEAYDVMLALLESKLGILEDMASALESRKAAESVASHLLDRLDSEKNILENSLGPWQDAVLLLSNSTSQEPWTEENDHSLRNHVSKLKGQRSSIQNTVVTLEAPFKNETQSPSGNRAQSKYENRRMDLETAILMQELMSMREDVSELKYRAEFAEREKMLVQQKLTALQEALIHLQSQLVESETLLAMVTKDRTSFSEAEHAANIERELVETLARESRLKARLQGLAGSLEVAAKTSEERHTQVQNTVTELKQTNLTLNLSLERCKKKYQTKLRKLEQQILGISLNAKAQTTSLQNTNQQLEKMGKNVIPETTL